MPLKDSSDPLANAVFTADERRIWLDTRAELEEARIRIRELENRIKALEHHNTDDLPSILTRPEFNREVARMLAFDERYGGTSSILYFNFENMTDIANRYGKSVINAAVREITVVLTKTVRGSDIVGRLAPDEFGILLIRCSNEDAWKKGKDISEKLLKALVAVHNHPLDPQISYGAYTFRSDEDVSTGLKQASQLLTKSNSKNDPKRS